LSVQRQFTTGLGGDAVFMVKFKKNGPNRILKIFKEFDQFYHELVEQKLANEILRGQSPKILKFGDVTKKIGGIEFKKRPFIVMEMASGKPLRDVLRARCGRANNRAFVKKTVKKLIDLVEKMESKGYRHCDLHPNNIIVKKNKFSIIDFGHSGKECAKIRAFQERARPGGRTISNLRKSCGVPEFEGLGSGVKSAVFQDRKHRAVDLITITNIIDFMIQGLLGRKTKKADLVKLLKLSKGFSKGYASNNRERFVLYRETVRKMIG